MVRKKAKSGVDWRMPGLLAAGYTLAFLLADAPSLEDAFISFRVLENLLDGHGLVFNPGERVEAHSNFLWVILLVPFRLLFGNIVAASKVLGWLVGLGVLAVADRLLREDLPEPGERAVALTALALCPHFLIFCVYGLETSLVYLCVLSAVWLLVAGRPGWASLACGLLAMTRPEGFLYFAALTAALAWLERGRIDWARWLLPFAACFGGLTIFRLAVYGVPFPNPVYGKAFSATALGSLLPGEGPVLPRKIRHGALQIAGFVAESFYWPILALAAFGAWPRAAAGRAAAGGRAAVSRESGRRRVVLLLAVIAATAVFLLGTGGNFFGRYRFWSVAVPPLLLLAASGAARLRPRGWRWTALALVVVVPLASVEHVGETTPFWARKARELPSGRSFFDNAATLLVRWTRPPDTLNRRLGDWLRETCPPGTLIATGQIGQIGYYSELPIFDVVGLADPVIARGGASVEYFLERAPEHFLVLGDRYWKTSPGGLPVSPHAAIYLTDAFRRHYAWRAILTGPPPHESFYWYVRRPVPLAAAPDLEDPPVYELLLDAPIPRDLAGLTPAP